MAYWLGVAGSREAVDRLRNQSETWWCAPKTATAGDLLAIYVAKNRLPDLPENEGGLVAIFEIVAPEPARASECKQFGGGFGRPIPVPFKIVVKERFPVSLRLAEMKLDATLASAQFVRRSFQGTIFAVSRPQFLRITELLTAKRTQAGQPAGLGELRE